MRLITFAIFIATFILNTLKNQFMLKIRLKKYGRKKLPVYRIVLMDSLSKRDGKALEELGLYNPHTNEIRLNLPRIIERLKQGARVTNTVKNIIQKYT